MPTRRLWQRRDRKGDQGAPGDQAGRDNEGRTLHVHRGGVPGRLRQRPHDPDQRRLLRRPDPRNHQATTYGAKGQCYLRLQRKGASRRSPKRPRDLREQRRPDKSDERTLGYRDHEEGLVDYKRKGNFLKAGVDKISVHNL